MKENSIWHRTGNRLPKKNPRSTAMRNKNEMSLWLQTLLCSLGVLALGKRFFKSWEGKTLHTLSLLLPLTQTLANSISTIARFTIENLIEEEPWILYSRGLFHSFLFSIYFNQPICQLLKKTRWKNREGDESSIELKIPSCLSVLITLSMCFCRVAVALFIWNSIL